MGNEFQNFEDDDWGEYVPAPVKSAKPATTSALSAAFDRDVRQESHSIERTGLSEAAPAPARSVPHRKSPRHFPGFIARSAMFRASHVGDYDAPTLVKAQGCSLTLSGPKLGMRDKHVWETAIQVAKERAADVGAAFEIELRDFARRMGLKNSNGRALSAIWSSLERLALARVEFRRGEKCKGVGSLIATAAAHGGKLFLRLNPDFAVPALMGCDQFQFDQARRAQLSTSLSQWLHDFFSTHSVARELDLAYLKQLCGYEGVGRNFAGHLRAAMLELVTTAPSVVDGFELVKGSRNSDAWKLRWNVGTEKRQFIQAQHLFDKPARRKSGVAL